MRARKSSMSTGTAVAEPTPAPAATGNASADAAKAERVLKLAHKSLDVKDASMALRAVKRLGKDHASGPVHDAVEARKNTLLTEASTKLAAARAATPVDVATLKSLSKVFKDYPVGAEAKAAHETAVKAVKDAKAKERADAAEEKEKLKNLPPEPVQSFGPGISEFVSIESIDLAPKDLRARGFDPEDEEYLNKVEYIKTNEFFLQPILLRPSTKPGRFFLMDGRNRWEAAKAVTAMGIDRTKIEAKVFKGLDATQGLEVALMANIQAKKMTKSEIADAMAILVTRFDGSLRQFAASKSMNVNTVSNLLALNNLISDARREVAKGTIAASKAYMLGRIPVESQKEWIEPAKELPANTFVKRVREFLGTAKPDGDEGEASREAAASAVSAKTHLSAKKMEEFLVEVCSADAGSGPGKVSDAFQAGMIAGVRACLGWNFTLGQRSSVGYETKGKEDMTRFAKK